MLGLVHEFFQNFSSNSSTPKNSEEKLHKLEQMNHRNLTCFLLPREDAAWFSNVCRRGEGPLETAGSLVG